MTAPRGAFAAEVGRIIFNDEAPRGVLLLIYTEGGITIRANWEDGAGYLGWCPLPIVDKEELARCLANPHKGFHPSHIQRLALMTAQRIPTQPLSKESSTIAATGHNGKAGEEAIMQIDFKRSGSYQYQNVPESLHQEIRTAESAGKTFDAQVKKNPGKFPYTKV